MGKWNRPKSIKLKKEYVNEAKNAVSGLTPWNSLQFSNGPKTMNPIELISKKKIQLRKWDKAALKAPTTTPLEIEKSFLRSIIKYHREDEAINVAMATENANIHQTSLEKASSNFTIFKKTVVMIPTGRQTNPNNNDRFIYSVN